MMSTKKQKSRKRAVSNKGNSLLKSSDDNTDNITSEENDVKEVQTVFLKSEELPSKRLKATRKPKQPKPGDKKVEKGPKQADEEDSDDEFVSPQSSSETKPKIPNRSILQLKIVLNEINPPIWRRIQVLNTNTFYNLHCHIKEAMGWKSNHAHHFIVHDSKKNKSIYVDNGVMEGLAGGRRGHLKEQTTKLSKLLSAKGDRLIYEYDFGNSWIHDIVVEKVLPPPGPKAEFPKCTGGKRACPPEDCGGVEGYQHLLEVYKDKDHPEYEELITDWLGEFNPGWQPEKFDRKQIFKKVWTWVLE